MQMFYIFSCTSNIFQIHTTSLLAMSSKRKCHLSPDSFCYICGYYIGSKQQKHKISPGMKLVTAYSAYFGIPIGDQDKTWSPHVFCRSCRSTLEGWLRGEIKCMYAICNAQNLAGTY